MDNSMTINLNSENNSMDSLTFSWVAYFKEGSIISQFNNGVENLFQVVNEKLDELTCFCLIKKDQTQCFKVYFPEGFIVYNNEKNFDLNNEKKEHIRLIFFRRHKVILSSVGIEENHKIEYHLGIQWNDKLGNNRKIILIIDEQGNWILGDN